MKVKCCIRSVSEGFCFIVDLTGKTFSVLNLGIEFGSPLKTFSAENVVFQPDWRTERHQIYLNLFHVFFLEAKT